MCKWDSFRTNMRVSTRTFHIGLDMRVLRSSIETHGTNTCRPSQDTDCGVTGFIPYCYLLYMLLHFVILEIYVIPWFTLLQFLVVISSIIILFCFCKYPQSPPFFDPSHLLSIRHPMEISEDSPRSKCRTREGTIMDYLVWLLVCRLVASVFFTMNFIYGLFYLGCNVEWIAKVERYSFYDSMRFNFH